MPDVVAEIIRSKTSKRQFIPSPDCPDEEARLYFMFHDHVWENGTIDEQYQNLKGTMSNVSAQDIRPSLVTQTIRAITNCALQSQPARMLRGSTLEF